MTTYPPSPNNPYASFGKPGNDFETPVATRTSILAVAALVLSLLCFVPGLGVLALMLGGAAILLISRSNGRLGGLGLAVTGCIIGLVTSVIWVLMTIGAVSAMQSLNSTMAPMLAPARTALTAIEQNDYGTARTQFTPTLAATVTDEQIKDFHQQYQAELGNFKSSPNSVADFVRGFISFGGQMGQNQAQMQQNQGQNLVPIPVEFDKGWALVFVQFTPNSNTNTPTSGTTQQPGSSSFVVHIANLGIATTTGKEFWLIPKASAITPSTPATPSTLPAPASPAAPSAPNDADGDGTDDDQPADGTDKDPA